MREAMRTCAFMALAAAAAACGTSDSPADSLSHPSSDAQRAEGDSSQAGAAGAGSAGSAASVGSVVGATTAQLHAFAALERETSQRWSWMQHDRFKTPMHLAGARSGKPLLKRGASVETTTLAFLAQYKELFRMRAPSTELSLVKSVVDELAMTHARFQQTVRGVPVVGAELAAHYDAAGHLTSIQATYVPDLEGIDVEPGITASSAVSVASAAAVARMNGAAQPSQLTISEGKLVVFALGDRPAALAYECTVRAVFGPKPAIWVTTIDAKTGEILDVYDNLQTIEATGTGVLGDSKKFQVSTANGGYAMLDTSRGVQIRTYDAEGEQIGPATGASMVTSSSLTTWDQGTTGKGAAVDAHAYAGVVFDYYKKVHARNAIDGNGGAMDSTVHFDQAYDNAFWDGTGMSYGDGGVYFKPLSAGLDVVAHEFTHGVTQSSSNLRYQNQPGALNESVSDIFGAMIEHSFKADETKNWQMGENIAKQAGLLRDFKNPAAGQQPAHMTKFVQTQQDNGGVHINSGIPNNAAFLMTSGGTNPTSKVEVKFGIGWELSEKIWYRANTEYFTTSTSFAQAAQATMQAAKDLSLTDNEQNIVDCAWKATGVVQGACGTITDPAAPPPSATPSPTPTEEGDTGDETSSGELSEGDPGDDGTAETTTTKKKRTLTPQASAGCSVGSQPGTGPSPFGALLAMAAGIALARRKRS